MDWVLQLDSQGLRLVNQAIANPLFDRLMPWLCWNSLFIPAVLIIAIALALRGGVRGRVFLVVLGLALLTTDGVLCNALKNLVQRPRPFLAEPGVRLLVGEGHSSGMPSAHAANWAAAAVIVWYYYGRRWFALAGLIGGVVGLARVYTGTHYPSDVLAGYVLGAGTAVAVLNLLNWVWSGIGRHLFPLWHARCPQLFTRACCLMREYVLTGNAPSAEEKAMDSEKQWLRLGYALVLLFLFLRLWYISKPVIELSFDEAYQWLWSKHLALSYYSKPPLIAYTQRLGTAIWGDTQFGVRFFSPILAAAGAIIMLRFLGSMGRAKTGVWLVLVCSTAPMLAVGSTLLTVDSLNVFFWICAMVAGWRAIQSQAGSGLWMITGLAMGLGFLSKYTALLQLVCWLGLMITYKPARAHLRKPGPYLTLGVLALCALPVVIWNAQHGWVTIRHLGERGGLTDASRPLFTLRYILDFLGSEMAVLNPVYFVFGALAVFACLRTGLPAAAPLKQLFFWMSVPVLALYTMLSFHNRVLPNWIAPAVIPMFALMMLYLEEVHWCDVARRVLLGGMVLGGVCVALLHDTSIPERTIGLRIPAYMDPLRRVRGWSKVSQLVATAKEEVENRTGRSTIVICNTYGLTSVVTFYWPQARMLVSSTPLVFCIEHKEPRNQFHFWPHYCYTNLKGCDAIFVGLAPRHQLRSDAPEPDPAAPHELQNQFESITYLGEIPVRVRGRILHKLRLWHCHNIK